MHVITEKQVELNNTYLSRAEVNGSEKWKQGKNTAITGQSRICPQAKHTSAVGPCGVMWGQARLALQRLYSSFVFWSSSIEPRRCDWYPAWHSEYRRTNTRRSSSVYTPSLSLFAVALHFEARQHLPLTKRSYVTLRKNARYFNTPNGSVTAGLTVRNLSTTSEPTQRSCFNCFAVKRNRFLNFKGINS